MSEWQDIASAPTDGTEVILAGRYFISGRWQVTSGSYLPHAKRWPPVGEDQPTHWQPLPSPPTQPLKGE